MRTTAIIGAGFGDEGKGRVTNALLNPSEKNLIVRFSGGHQAGHKVVHEGREHIFASFGSGTLQEAHTCWTKYCTFYPSSFLVEYDALKDIKFKYFLSPDSPLTTPYEVELNRTKQVYLNNGTCGLGVGATFERQNKNYHLYVMDIMYPDILKIKLKNIGDWYKSEHNIIVPQDRIDAYLRDCQEILELDHMNIGEANINLYDSVIFEGSQGSLLDQELGFFPYVTHSYTTTTNVIELCNAVQLPLDRIILVSRCYQTRHGNGPITGKPLTLELPETERNVSNEYQGDFRVATLDEDTLLYAIRINNIPSIPMGIVFTCLDQLPNPQVWSNDANSFITLDEFSNKLNKMGISVRYSNSETSELEDAIKHFESVR